MKAVIGTKQEWLDVSPVGTDLSAAITVRIDNISGGWMDSIELHAIKGQKVLLLVSSLVLLVASVGFFFFWQMGKAPLYVALIFLLIAIVLLARAAVLFRAPVVRIEKDRIILAGWFGKERVFDALSPIEIFGTEVEVVIKQGKSVGTLARYVVGKDQYEEALRFIRSLN